MEESASRAPKLRAEPYKAGELENVAMVEIDVVDGLKRLLRDGSPRLRQALITAALANAPRN